MMQNRILYMLLGLVVLILLIRASVFTVTEGQLAIKSMGGDIVDFELRAGPAFSVPLVEEVAASTSASSRSSIGRSCS